MSIWLTSWWDNKCKSSFKENTVRGGVFYLVDFEYQPISLRFIFTMASVNLQNKYISIHYPKMAQAAHHYKKMKKLMKPKKPPVEIWPL